MKHERRENNTPEHILIQAVADARHILDEAYTEAERNEVEGGRDDTAPPISHIFSTRYFDDTYY